jgi:hypothetical protein
LFGWNRKECEVVYIGAVAFSAAGTTGMSTSGRQSTRSIPVYLSSSGPSIVIVGGIELHLRGKNKSPEVATKFVIACKLKGQRQRLGVFFP